jgi:hypothetical protein
MVLESSFWNYIWADAFRQFMIYFVSIHCSGILISFSLFAGRAMSFQRKALLKFMSTLIFTLIIITGLYIFTYETVYPLVTGYVRELRALSTMSTELYKGAGRKEAAGDHHSALIYIDLSLAIDENNPEKINRKLEIMKSLSAAELKTYEQQHTGGEQSALYEGEDVQKLLKHAEDALEDKDYANAYTYAESVLALDSRNNRAMWISNIAWEEISEKKLNPDIEKTRYLISEKRRGFTALLKHDYIDAYYIFKDLEKQYPYDSYIKYYLGEIAEELPSVSFFSDEAELVLSLPIPGIQYLVFFNKKDESSRELISIDKVVHVADGMFFKNVEVLGFLKQGSILYHYVVPYGKLIGGYININCIGRDKRSQGHTPDYLSGVPPVDKTKGIKLHVNPLDFSYYKLTPNDLREMSIWQLVKTMGITKNFANNDKVLFLEIVYKLSIPFLLLVLSLICARIAVRQGMNYVSSPPRSLYLFLPVIPFIVLFATDLVVYLYKIITGFVYFSFGGILTVVLLLTTHLLLIALLFYAIGRRLDKMRKA